MSETPVLCKCGATEPLPSDAARCCNGHPLPGFPGPAFKHGVRSFQVRGVEALPPETRQTIEVFREAVIQDRGGPENLTTVEAGYIRRLAELETVARLLASELAAHGVLTPRRRVRGIYGKWLETLDRWHRFAQAVGTERRARQVPTLREYLEQRTSQVDEERPC